MIESSIKNDEIVDEYNQLFLNSGINPLYFQHQWNKEGDNLKVFTLYEEQPTPILTQNTFSV